VITPPSDKDPYEINAIQSTDSTKSSARNQKKGKGKQKQNNAKFGKKPNFLTNESPNCKPKYPCLICSKDHFTKYCPHHYDVNRFVKGNTPPPAVLKNPFCNQTNQVESQDQTTNSTSS